MSNIQLVLIPPFMSTLVEDGSIKKGDLLNWDALRSILSDLTVAKYFSLNYQTPVGTAGYMEAGTLLYVNNLKEYVYNDYCNVPDEVKVAAYRYKGTLDYLCQLGDEELNPVLNTQLTNYVLQFKVIHISNKIYGIMYQPLQTTELVGNRNTCFQQDLGSLLDQVSSELSDAELLGEPLYQAYLSTL